MRSGPRPLGPGKAYILVLECQPEYGGSPRGGHRVWKLEVQGPLQGESVMLCLPLPGDSATCGYQQCQACSIVLAPGGEEVNLLGPSRVLSFHGNPVGTS